MGKKAEKRMSLRSAPLILLMLVLLAPLRSRSEDTPFALHVPAFTAYSEPDPEALNIDRNGLTEWTRAGEQLVWYGKINQSGNLDLSVTVRLPASATAHY